MKNLVLKKQAKKAFLIDFFYKKEIQYHYAYKCFS